MKVLFTVISFKNNDSNNYLIATKKLAKEIISLTPHDILITTNEKAFFNDIISDRIKVRDTIDPELKISLNSEFNYNSKYEAFLDLPKDYDIIFYVDGDIKLKHWDDKSDEYLNNIFSTYEYGATRLNAVLSTHYENLKTSGNDLFKHKFLGHDLIDINENDPILNSKLPSEHFLIFKNSEKVNLFAKNWKAMCFYLQNKNEFYGTLCDGFEIGICVTRANITEIKDISHGDSVLILGLDFNGNKI